MEGYDDDENDDKKRQKSLEIKSCKYHSDEAKAKAREWYDFNKIKL